MKLKINLPKLGTAEYEETDYPYTPMTDKRFKALCRIAYAAIYMVGQLAALYLVGKIALVALFPAFIIALIVAVDDDGK